MKTQVLQHNDTFNLKIGFAVASFPHVIEPTINDVDPRNPKEEYSIDIIIPKDTDMTHFKRVVEEVVLDKWGNKRPEFRYEYLKDGDQKFTRDGEPYEGYENSYYITAKSDTSRKPQVTDLAGNILAQSDDIVGGDIVHAFISVFAYDRAGNCGVSFGLNTVKLYQKTDSPFGGGVSKATAGEALGDFDELAF